MGVRSVLALGLIARLSAPLLLPHRRGALPGACQWSGRVSRGTSPFVVSRSLATDVVEDAESEQESSGEVKDAAEWDTLLCALEAYREEQGDLRVPTRFCVPEESAYPEKCWGLKLGQRVASIRATGRYVGDETRRRKLDDLGFEWRLRRPSSASSSPNEPLEPFEVLLTALQSYKDLHEGSVSMPANFVVPRVDPWPAACRGLPLGSRLQTIKESDVPYFDAEQVPADVVASREAELARLGVMRRPPSPAPAPDGDEAGGAPSSSSSKGGGKAAKESKASSTSKRFEIVYSALVSYKDQNGHVNVPQTFIVPAAAPWPEEAWEMKLGSRVNAIRSHGTFLKRHPERRQRLMDLGLVLNVEPEPERSGSILDAVLLSKSENWAANDEAGVDEEDEAPKKRIVPFSTDFLDVTEVPEADLAVAVRDGFRFDEFDGGYDFEDVVDAVAEYKARYGDTLVPLDFVVPTDADVANAADDAEGSEEAENLDAALAAFLSSASAPGSKKGDDDDASDAAVAAALMGAGDGAGEGGGESGDETAASPFDDVSSLLMAAGDEPSLADLEALEAEEPFGDDVSSLANGLFAVDALPWPEQTRGLLLGKAVEMVRIGDAAAWDDPDRKAALDAVGFDWGDRAIYVRGLQWDVFLATLFSYSKIKGTLNVVWDFVVPHEDPWPLPLRGFPLGTWVNEIRDQADVFDAHFGERKRFLDLMGFQWLPPIFDAGEEEFDDRLPPCLRLSLEELGQLPKRRRKAAKPKVKKEPLAMPVEGEVTDYTKYTVAVLKDILRDRKLPVSGRRKADYVERLDEDDAKKAELKKAAEELAAQSAPSDDLDDDDDDDDDLDDDDDDDDDEIADEEEEIDVVSSLNEALASETDGIDVEAT